MASKLITTLDGSNFLVAAASGDLVQDPDHVTGFFYRDMRHLSRWRLLINGAEPQVLSCDDLEYYFSQHFLAPRTGTIYENPYLSVARRRYLGDGFVEEIELQNHLPKPVDVTVELEFGCDFADLFEVKNSLKKKGELYQKKQGNELILGYRREDFVRETILRCDSNGELSEGRLKLPLSLKAKEKKIVTLEVIPVSDQITAKPKYSRSGTEAKPNIRTDFKDWMLSAPKVECSLDAINRLYRKSLSDLAALRFYPDPVNLPQDSIPAAGLPWFMAMFGRDSLITSYQTLPFVPELSATTLRTLARFQGKEVNAFRDEEPGKIPHELRFGELTVFKEWPQSPYYGSADSTALFLILLDEYERWTGDRALIRSLEPNAVAALDWIDRYGDRDGDGFVEYMRALDTGLDNQCWKDSWNSILFSDGRVAEAPRATCEIQGYTYDAKVRCARLAREVWNNPKLAEELEAQAEKLKARFNEAFWIPEKGYYALALDKHKTRVDSLTSNVGHLLWSGIVPNDRAERIRDLLMSPKLFSGWGIRTMSTDDRGYNPIEYHNGTVWPHDASIIAQGLAQYGFRKEASSLCTSTLAAGAFFNYRLPEVFAGFERGETEFPVEYPTASSPQAWATGTTFLALRTILGLEARDGKLIDSPSLTEHISYLSIQGIKGPWGSRDIKGVRDAAGSEDALKLKFFMERSEKLARKKRAG